MRKIRLHRWLTLVVTLTLCSMMAWGATVERGPVKMQYESNASGGITVINVWNNGDYRIELMIDASSFTINANSSLHLNKEAYRFVKYSSSRGGDELWRPARKKEVSAEPAPAVTAPVETRPDRAKEEKVKKDEPQLPSQPQERRQQEPQRSEPRNSRPAVTYVDKLNNDEFFGIDAVSAYTKQVDALCKSLDEAKDKAQFMLDNDVEQFLDASEAEIKDKKLNIPTEAQAIVTTSNVDPASQASTINTVVEILTDRLKTREAAFNRLQSAVENAGSGHTSSHSLGGMILNYGLVLLIVAILVVLTVVAMRRKKQKQNKNAAHMVRNVAAQDVSTDNPAIVVRRRTTSILKKQNIDDVVGNPAYMVINASEFTPDSAIKKIYIKNTCIKEVYNLYAEDLRKTENPKEDGCMVLGRWVQDPADHTYDISLEEVVFPGDDAVFKEYELNFGGKIKLRVAEKLRKLRRDTGLQYDLVCWIHSHPGLGVFFSNSDDNVQNQLKHSQHPNFLIAFVVDILTSSQETGIFTFRRDGSMNSKGDLTKMYSLEEMYKWALQSERSSFSPDNYFNLLGNAKLKLPLCRGVELNNSSIIDMSQIVIEPETGIVGWAVGTTVEHKGGQEYAVSGIVRKSEKPGAGVIGCLISLPHMSFPSIQRMIAHESANLAFVMVYSSKLMTLTTIPVVNGELLSDEQFYGDENFDNLKIWTRRKR